MLESIVSIESSNENNDSFGTGFAIYNDKKGVYILTCKHVTDDVQHPTVEEYPANIIASSDFNDMAVLYVENLHLQPLPLQVDSCESLEVDVIGFSHFNQHLAQKKHIHATLFSEAIELHSNRDDSFYSVREIKAKETFQFERGNSGSPVVCKETGHVIAMVSNKRGKAIAYAIEIIHLEEVWENLPQNLLEREHSVHNHLPFDYGYKKAQPQKDSQPLKKKEKKIRYITAGVITLVILALLYFFFFKSNTTNLID